MKTNAQRQKELRQRRVDNGAHRRLNVWISTEAYDALSEAARQRKLTRMALLNALLLDLAAVTPSQEHVEKNDARDDGVGVSPVVTAAHNDPPTHPNITDVTASHSTHRNDTHAGLTPRVDVTPSHHEIQVSTEDAPTNTDTSPEVTASRNKRKRPRSDHQGSLF